MIPKKIHYCWFGGNPLPKEAIKCIESWKKFCPDYEIIEWNESNYDLNKNEYVKFTYENKKFAFLSDYVRLDIIYNEGGIYLDTDMEITKDISDILLNECFLGVEDSGLINSAVIGAKEPHNKFIDELIKSYDEKEKFNSEDIYAMTIPRQITEKLNKLGFNKEFNDIQKFYDGKVVVYPREYFYPLSYDHQDNKFTANSCMIHHYDSTWASKPEKAKLFFRRHNMKFMLRSVDICVSIKMRICRIINKLRGKKNETEY